MKRKQADEKTNHIMTEVNKRRIQASLTLLKSSGSYSILARESKMLVKSIMVRRFSSSDAVPGVFDEVP